MRHVDVLRQDIFATLIGRRIIPMVSKMAPDLLNQITNEFRGDTLNRIASAIGVNSAKTQTALSSLVPAILSSLASKASTTAGAKDVIYIMRPKHLPSL